VIAGARDAVLAGDVERRRPCCSCHWRSTSRSPPIDPRLAALTVALATSNAFLIPTHQVNALIMTPGGYEVRDFPRRGIMTVLFLAVLSTGCCTDGLRRGDPCRHAAAGRLAACWAGAA
jgi:hypothetical protein